MKNNIKKDISKKLYEISNNYIQATGLYYERLEILNMPTLERIERLVLKIMKTHKNGNYDVSIKYGQLLKEELEKDLHYYRFRYDENRRVFDDLFNMKNNIEKQLERDDNNGRKN